MIRDQNVKRKNEKENELFNEAEVPLIRFPKIQKKQSFE